MDNNRYYSKRLPEMLGVFQGLTFVVTISFFCHATSGSNHMCCLANDSTRYCFNSIFYCCIRIYRCLVISFLRTCTNTYRIASFYLCTIEVGPVVVNHGLKAEWLQHLNQFAESNKPLKEQFPYGFMLQGNGKFLVA